MNSRHCRAPDPPATSLKLEYIMERLDSAVIYQSQIVCNTVCYRLQLTLRSFPLSLHLHRPHMSALVTAQGGVAQERNVR